MPSSAVSPTADPVGRGRSRRRQRSVRVRVAAVLLSLATTMVLLALVLANGSALTAAALVTLACGWAALRILCTELAQSRRRHLQDRAAQARAFQALDSERSAEHVTFATSMTERLTARAREVRELEGTLRLSEARAADAEARARREGRRADDAQERVVELEVALAIRTAEEADELASWEPGHPDADTVVDLLAWEERRPPGDAAEVDTVVDLLAWEDRAQTTASARNPLRKRA